eukprot:168324_1
MSAAETITPLIQIQEKLENCDEKQEKIFCQEFKHKLLELDIWDKIDFVKHLLCCIHSNLTTDFFQELLDLFPHDNNDDDEYKDDDTYTSSEHVLITELPTDLLIHSFQYLEITDLYNLEKTCRSLCILARNPLSLYHLNIAYKSYFEKFVNYQNNRYLKLQSLTLDRYTEDFGAQNDDRFDYWTSLLPVFPLLSRISVINTNFNFIGIIPSSICSGRNIKEVHFYNVSIVSVFTLISKCKNIEILDFVTGYDENVDASYQDTFMSLINSSSENALPYLKHLMIDLSNAKYLSGQYLVYWLLANGFNRKTLTLMDNVNIGDSLLFDTTASVVLNSFFNPDCSDSHIFDIQRRALLNISNLNLGTLDVYSINNFAKWMKMDNNMQFDSVNVDLINVYTKEFMYNSAPYSFPNDLMNPLHIVLSKCKQSKIYWSKEHQIIDTYSRTIMFIKRFTMAHHNKGIIGMMRDWPSRILKGDLLCQTVSEMQIMPIIMVKEFYAHYDIFNGAIKYWLELKCSKTVKIQYDVTFQKDVEIGRCERLWDIEIEEIEWKCKKYPIQVDITSSCSKIRVCF